MPVVFARGAMKLGADLDAHYLHHYFYNSGIGSNLWDLVFRAERELQLKAEVVS